jgi:hypothetical protein
MVDAPLIFFPPPPQFLILLSLSILVVTMADKVKETAREEVHHVQALTSEAVQSGAWIYPAKVCSSRWLEDRMLTDLGREFSTSSLIGVCGSHLAAR